MTGCVRGRALQGWITGALGAFASQRRSADVSSEQEAVEGEHSGVYALIKSKINKYSYIDLSCEIAGFALTGYEREFH